MVVVAIRMRSVQVMKAVDVSAERVNTYLARTGFIERRRLALGSFLSPEDVDSMAALITSPSQFLRSVRGIDVRCGTGSCVPIPRNQSCLWLFVDGTPHGFARQLDSLGLTPNAIAAVEVYERPSIVPLEFQGALPQKQGRSFSTTGGCGAIALWTKTRVP
jgi:hypothetical protein